MRAVADSCWRLHCYNKTNFISLRPKSASVLVAIVTLLGGETFKLLLVAKSHSVEEIFWSCQRTVAVLFPEYLLGENMG